MAGVKAKRQVTEERLRSVAPFEHCSADVLGQLAAGADEVAVPSGYVLVFEGQYGDDVFVVAEGDADVTDRGRWVASVGPGGIVGEQAAPDVASPSATITAASPMRLFVFDRALFTGLHVTEGLAV